MRLEEEREVADVNRTGAVTRGGEVSDARDAARQNPRGRVVGVTRGNTPRGQWGRPVVPREALGGDGIDAGHEHGVGVVARRRRWASQRPIDRVGEVTFVGVVAVTVGAVVVATGR